MPTPDFAPKEQNTEGGDDSETEMPHMTAAFLLRRLSKAAAVQK